VVHGVSLLFCSDCRPSPPASPNHQPLKPIAHDDQRFPDFRRNAVVPVADLNFEIRDRALDALEQFMARGIDLWHVRKTTGKM
jgi:hypothetical protein